MSDVVRGTWPDLLTIPRAPVRLVPRLPQLRRLDRLAPVTIVEALPGFGKTTLGVAWAQQLHDEGCRVTWIQAREDLDDESRFMEALQRGLDVSGANASRDPDSLLMVIVDDAEYLRNPGVTEALLRLVNRTARMHLTALTRPEHRISEAAARHHLETNVLGGGDLGIPADEVIAFAEAWGHDLDPDAAQRLHELVGGWLLPLRLALDATPSWSTEFATHAAHDFLMERVLSKMSDAELVRASRLAVPQGLDVGLATAILDDDAPLVRGHLAALERKGLLWRQPSNKGPVRWRYPTLLRRVLLDRLERTQPGDARVAHQLAAHALATADETATVGEMLRHARAGDDWSLLARLWTDRGWSLVGGDAAAFQAAYAAIPAATLQEHPFLWLPAALGDALTATSDETDLMHRVETLLRRYTDTGSSLLRQRRVPGGPGLAAELLTAAMIARRTDGDLPEARKLAAAAATELARARLLEPRRARTSQVAWFHLQHAITQLHGSRHDEAFREATTAHQVEPRTIVGAGAAALLAAIHAFTGLNTIARQWLAAHESVDLSGAWASGLAELPARLTRATLALDLLDAEAAEAELAHVQLGPESSGLWPLIVLTHNRHALLFGDPVAMLSRLEHVTRVLGRHLRHDGSFADQVVDRCRTDLLLALGEVNRVAPQLQGTNRPWLLAPAARFHLITGSHDAAARVAAAAVWREDIAVRDRLELLVISSVALQQMGRTDRAVEAFRRAHALYLDVRTLQPLLLMSPEVRGKLLDAAGLQLPPEVSRRMDSVGRIYPECAEVVSLSPRELEVLRRMHDHDSMASLARSLNVSINTVKKQLVSLYAKLGVHDRSSALLRAHALGLVETLTDVRTESG